jgi:hypothetical protein
MGRSPEELQRVIADVHQRHNHEHHHEALGNLRPVDVYLGHDEAVLSRRREVQRRTLASRRQHNASLGPAPEQPIAISRVHLESELALSTYRGRGTMYIYLDVAVN